MIRKLIVKPLLGVFMFASVLGLFGGGVAGAMPLSGTSAAPAANFLPQITHHQFSATGNPILETFKINITTPPMLGQGFSFDENLVDASNNHIAVGHIDCKIIAFTTTTLQFFCNASYTFDDGSGTLKAIATFSATATSTQPHYVALVKGGTGSYTGAFGTVDVTDNGPGLPEQYVFDFYTLS